MNVKHFGFSHQADTRFLQIIWKFSIIFPKCEIPQNLRTIFTISTPFLQYFFKVPPQFLLCFFKFLCDEIFFIMLTCLKFYFSVFINFFMIFPVIFYVLLQRFLHYFRSHLNWYNFSTPQYSRNFSNISGKLRSNVILNVPKNFLRILIFTIYKILKFSKILLSLSYISGLEIMYVLSSLSNNDVFALFA